MYKENPKTIGSGLLACIPQTGICSKKCPDCFFQSGRSYLEPLAENLPNMPPDAMADCRVVRVNDGNDSHNQLDEVLKSTVGYPMRFYNTSVPLDLEKYNMPVVLTVNPGPQTDHGFAVVNPIPKNLMFVRVRANTWNIDNVVVPAVTYYGSRNVPVVLTFMAYFTGTVPDAHKCNYKMRIRTINRYWAITTEAWEKVMARFRYNIYVYCCGKIEGELGISLCRHCGNCLREYFATMERLRG